jgi:hypothetical protein
MAGSVAVRTGRGGGLDDSYDAPEDKHSKRRRLTYQADDYALESSSSASTIPAASFLGFHLQLLKSLYFHKTEHDDNKDGIISSNCAGTSNATANANATDTLSPQQQDVEVESEKKDNKWDDGPVDPSVWNMAESFLVRRSSLAQTKQEATRLRGIHQEASLFIEQGEFRLPFHKKNAAGASTTDAAVSPIHQYRRLHSPILSHASQYDSPTNKAKSAARTTSFGIVSSLLQRRSKSADKAFQQQIHPFQPLLQQTRDLVQKLQEMLKVHKDAQLQKDQAITNELLTSAIMQSQPSQQSAFISGGKKSPLSSPSQDECCRLMQLETKLKVWSLLAQDLRHEIA